MSGYSPYDKTPGKNSRVTAADVAATPDVATMEPGRTNLVQTPELGDPWIDGAAPCGTDAQKGDGGQGVAPGARPEKPGCFLPDDKRARLLMSFTRRVTVAQTNYKLALEQMRVDELLKKDDDVNWVLGLILDVASAYLGNTTTKALTKVDAKSAYFSKVSDGLIQAAVKTGFDKAKGGIKSEAKDAHNREAQSKKAASLSYINQLEASCDVAFETFTSTVAAGANDAQLTVLWEGFAPEYHSVDIYKTELTKKLDRYMESGVPNIGSKRLAGEGMIAPHYFEATRVIWVRGAGGKTTLYFQVSHGIKESPFDVDGGEMHPVPAEFVDAAIARHQIQWGDIPSIDDPAVPVAERLVHPMTDIGPHPMRRLQLGRKP